MLYEYEEERVREKGDCQVISTVKLFSTVNYHYRDNKRLQNKLDSSNIYNLQIYMIHTYTCICINMHTYVHTYTFILIPP